MNTSDQNPSSTHSAERVLYKVEVRRKETANPGILLGGKLIGTRWEQIELPDRRYALTDHLDTAAELDDGLFPYPMAMMEAWGILSCEHAHAFEVRLVPYVVKTSYAAYPQEPLPELDRNPA